MAITSNNTFVAGEVLTAAECNNFPFGVVGAVQSVAGNITITTTATDVSGMSITFTAIAGRTYKFNVQASATSGTTQQFIELQITNAANAKFAGVYAGLTAGEYANLSFSNYITGVAAGSITFKMRVSCQTSTGTLLRSGSDYLSFWIEDIGTA